MGKGILDRCLFEIFQGPIPQWPSACGENNPLDRLARIRTGPIALESLEDRAVLAVDRDDFGSGFLGAREQQLAGNDEGFFVGQSQSLAVLNCGQTRFEPGHADDCCDDDIDFRTGDRLD